jgi:hypothetical protein
MSVGEIISGMRTVYFRYILSKTQENGKTCVPQHDLQQNVKERCKKLTFLLMMEISDIRLSLVSVHLDVVHLFCDCFGD